MVRFFALFFSFVSVTFAIKFNGVETVIEQCGLDVTVTCPHCLRGEEDEGYTNSSKTDIQMDFEMSRFLGIIDVTESFEFSAVIMLSWPDQCLKDLYNNETLWPNKRMDRFYDI